MSRGGLLSHSYGLLDEKCFGDRIAGEIELQLEGIDVLVESVRDDLFRTRKRELRAKLPQALLRQDPECPDGSPRDRVKGILGTNQAELNRAGELPVEQEESDDPLPKETTVAFPIEFQRARRLEDKGPLDLLHRRAASQEVLEVDDTRKLIGPFDETAEAAEVPRLSVGHRIVREPLEEPACQLQLAEKLIRRVSHPLE